MSFLYKKAPTGAVRQKKKQGLLWSKRVWLIATAILLTGIFGIIRRGIASNVTVRQEINIINSSYSQVNATISSGEIVSLNTASFSGTKTYYFEVVASATAGSSGNIRLRRTGTTTDDATIALSSVGTSKGVYRSASFSPPAGATNYFLFADAGGASKTVTISSARIIILQISNPLTATETQVEIGNNETGKTNTSPQALTNPKYWTYTSGNWSPAPSFYAEVTWKSAAVNATIVLQQDDGSFGNWANVANGTIVNATTAASATRTRTGTAFTPVNGRHYRIVSSIASAGSYDVYNAKVVAVATVTSGWADSGLASGVFRKPSISDDGRTMFTGDGARLYISTNGGGSWAETQPAGNVTKFWKNTAMSSDGQVLVTGVNTGGRLYISTNGGGSWAETQPAGAVDLSWNAMAMSNDGQTIIAGAYGGRIYLTTNGGGSWAETQPAGNFNDNWWSATMSSDGQIIYVGSAFGRVYKSSNGGGSWAETQPAGNIGAFWYDICTSDDGQNVLAVRGAGTGRLYLSTTGGGSWAETQPGGNVDLSWQTCGMNGSNGQTMLAGINGGRLYLTTTGGGGWSETQPAGAANKNWIGAAISSNGSTRLAGESSGPLWVYSSPTAVSKFEGHYLLANTSFGGSTGLKDFDTSWDPSEWSGVANAYYHEANGVASGTGDVDLQTDPNGSPTIVTGSTITDTIEVERSNLTMPVSSATLDVNVTGTGTLNASRIIVAVAPAPPNAPTLSSPADTLTNVSRTPTFQLSTTDVNGDYVQYKIEVCSNSDCSSILRTINQVSSQTGWSGQDADSGNAYASGTTASHAYQTPALSYNTQYWWRASAIDPADSNTWGSASSIYSFTTIPNSTPAAPTLSSPSNTATGIRVLPIFQLRTTDADGDYVRYKIEVCSTSNCSSIVRTIDQSSSQTGWMGQDTDSGNSYFTSSVIGSSTMATHQYQLNYLGSNTQYWWRAYAKDFGAEASGQWSSASSIWSFTTATSMNICVGACQ